MARDYLTIGSAPSGEECAQVGSDDYEARMRRETRAFIGQIIRQLGEPPTGARLAVKGFPHDYGTYHEVVCWYDDNYPDSVEYAFKCEAECPENWDAAAEVHLLPKFLDR